MATEKNNKLQKLSKSDYEIVDGQPDIRGWDVKAEDGKYIGEVDDLIFDPQSRKVRYIVLDLDDNELGLDDREVLVPIGIAQLHGDDDDVLLPGVTIEQLSSLPGYDEDQFDYDSEGKIRTALAGVGGAALAGTTQDEFYQHDHFNEDNLYRNRSGLKTEDESATIPVVKEELQIGKREVETGGVRLRSRVVEEQVAEDINLREETVRIERRDVDRKAGDADFSEEEIEVREYDEVPVVNKEARVVEEIKLSKEVNERNEIIRDTVRNTEVDIDRKDGDNLRKDRS